MIVRSVHDDETVIAASSSAQTLQSFY